MNKLIFALVFLALLIACQPRNPKYEALAADAKVPYEVVQEVENLLDIGLKNKRFSPEQWTRIQGLTESQDLYTRKNVCFIVQVVDRNDAGQREKALAILQKMTRDSDPEVKKYAEAGLGRMQRIPEKGP
jgi:hypothetical protein